MDNINNYYDNTDCDSADCNTTRTEYAEDFLVETSPASIEEFPAIPTEYVNMPDTEFGEDQSPESEQAATYDGFSNFDDLYGDNGYDDESTETSEDLTYDEVSDNSAETSEDLAYDEALSRDIGYDVTENFYDPFDELAATTDDLYTTPTKSCATERCKLDDYEIISDVLGSEKQIVKLYSTALCEASEEHFRNVIRENLDDAAADQYKAFEFMQSRGMYPTEQAQECDITQAKQQFGPLCCNNDQCE